jgi:hypothetical protein
MALTNIKTAVLIILGLVFFLAFCFSPRIGGFEPIKKAQEGLRSIPWIVVGLIYFLFIPYFALIYYWCVPDGFYDSELTHERSFLEDERKIREIFQQKLTTNLTEGVTEGGSSDLEGGVRPLIAAGAWYVAITNMQVVDTTDVQFTVSVSLGGLESPAPNLVPEETLQFLVKAGPFDLNDVDKTIKELKMKEGGGGVFSVLINFSPQPSVDPGKFMDETMKRLFPKKKDPYTVEHKDWSYLDLSPDQELLLGKYVSASLGSPSAASDAYLRMLYFSATTITTLGFGDIVPVNPSARLWVAFEAISGIFLIGLFVNSLFYKS